MTRSVPQINSIGVADHAWGVFGASANAQAVVFPRGFGTFIKGLTIPEIRLTVNCWSIFTSVQSKEQRINDEIPNRFTIGSLCTVVVSGNTYNNCRLESYSVNDEDKLWANYTFTFLLGDQGTTSITASLRDGAGTAATFVVPNLQSLDRTIRTGGTFTFWSHAYASAASNWAASVETGSIHTIKPLGGGSRTITVRGWVIGPTTNIRTNLEKYFYSMSRDACGRIGILNVSGNSYLDCFLQSVSMDGDDVKSLNFTASFLTSTRSYN